MKQPFVNLTCPISKREEVFYFVIGPDGLPYPNYCENASGAAACKSCALHALDLLVAKAEKHTPDVYWPPEDKEY